MESEVLARLTPREFEIATAVAGGLCNKDIATRFGIALQTVKDHVSTIFLKLDVESRVQLAVLVVRETPPSGVELPSTDRPQRRRGLPR